jgi:hypothetical protein
MSFKSFPTLPVELVSLILGFLEFQDLLSCSEVCFATRLHLTLTRTQIGL